MNAITMHDPIRQAAADTRADRPEASPASIRGTLAVPANSDIGHVRVRIRSQKGVLELPVEAGTYATDDLDPGTYCVELVADRLILARRVSLDAGEQAVVDFTLR